MADHCIQLQRRSRFIRNGLTACGWFFAAAFNYVAIIGPLAFLESRGFATYETWRFMHGTIYGPSFLVRVRGPRWLSWVLECYSAEFELPSPKRRDLGPHFGASFNRFFRHRFLFEQILWRKMREDLWYQLQISQPLSRLVYMRAIGREVEENL